MTPPTLLTLFSIDLYQKFRELYFDYDYLINYIPRKNFLKHGKANDIYHITARNRTANHGNQFNDRPRKIKDVGIIRGNGSRGNFKISSVFQAHQSMWLKYCRVFMIIILDHSE